MLYLCYFRSTVNRYRGHFIIVIIIAVVIAKSIYYPPPISISGKIFVRILSRTIQV